MHISEGILSGPVLIGGAALAGIGVAVGLRKTDYEELPQTALIAAVFFVTSLIHIPLGPVSAHLVLNGLCGLVLGWAAFPAIITGLTLQAVLFQYGGITTLGVNTCIMAYPAVLFGFLCRPGIRSQSRFARTIFQFICGAASIITSGVLVALPLILTGEQFKTAAKLALSAHVPIAILEGIITVILVEFLLKMKPEIFKVRTGSPTL